MIFQNDANSRAYSRAARLHLYVEQKWLPAEASLLIDYGSEIASKRVLEIGAGSGRIASVLNHRCSKYVATDINPQMISTLVEVHDRIEAAVADACNLEQFRDCSFDTVLFCFNGLDSIPFESRQRALSEICRVLIPGGAFIHSTHNLAHATLASHVPNYPGLFRQPFKFVRQIINRRRLAKHESYSADYALINDRALQNGLLNVYIAHSAHKSHLSDAGFNIEAYYERTGERIDGGGTPTDQWYYVVARKI